VWGRENGGKNAKSTFADSGFLFCRAITKFWEADTSPINPSSSEPSLSADGLKKRSGLLVAKLCWLLKLIYFENKNVLLPCPCLCFSSLLPPRVFCEHGACLKSKLLFLISFKRAGTMEHSRAEHVRRRSPLFIRKSNVVTVTHLPRLAGR